jgi:mono/diheme cytochrome c family protein
MKTLTALLICAFAALFYVACASPEPANTNSSSTANSNSSAAPAMTGTTPSPSPTPTPNTAAAQPGPTVVTARPAASPAAGTKEEKPAPTPAASANGAELFAAQKCVGCHGADGKGKLKGSPDFTDAAWQKKRTDAEMIETIKKGHKPMPGYEDKLSAEQINALVAYVRSFPKK